MAAPPSISNPVTADANTINAPTMDAPLIDAPPANVPPADAPPTNALLVVFELSRRQIAVRHLRQEDVRALEWHGGPDLRSFYEQQWASHRAGEICALVADFNNFPIGQLAIHWQGKATHPRIPDVQSVRVLEAFRGMGIGSRLLEVGERLIGKRGFKQASLAVAVDNPAAQRLYERLGYHVVGAPYRDVWHYTNAQGQNVIVEEEVLDMVKTLS